MKSLLMFFLVLTVILANGQLLLPLDFETSPVTADFTDFDGGKATVVANPRVDAINPSSKVAQIVRQGGALWAGSKLKLKDNLKFEINSILTMKVYTTAPIGTVVKFKLESTSGSIERDVSTKSTKKWETLIWDFTGATTKFDEIVFMFDFGKIGNGTETSTFLFDDVMQLFSGKQLDLPVNFEGSILNYTMTDFGGNKSSLFLDPTDSNNHVIQVIKTTEAATWAGTTIGTNGGFKTNIPLKLTDSKMNVKVWSPEAGIPIRLKVEDSKDPTHTCETQMNTTVAGKWETIVFDFKNHAMGTELLSVGLSKGWTYNKASIFFNFGKDGVSVGEKTYYFDDVNFGNIISGLKEEPLAKVDIYPNPSSDYWTVSSKNDIKSMEIFDINGHVVRSQIINNSLFNIDAKDFKMGVYLLKLKVAERFFNYKLVK